ncbi:MAG: PQQ-binding-like beta-propeller repeat protein [Thermoanaerobaculia bacterium]
MSRPRGFPARVPAVGLIALSLTVPIVSRAASHDGFADSFVPRRIRQPSAVAVVSLVPTSGSASGGVSLSIGGAGFQAGAGVSVGGTAATGVVVQSATKVSAVTPTLAPGTLNNIVVTNPDTSSGVLVNGFLADFTDLPQGHLFHASVERIFRAAITAGCGGGAYCTNAAVTRAQMAVFVLKAEHGPGYSPPPCAGIFPDVPCSPTPAFAVDWIEQLHNEGISAGCGNGNYCPQDPVSRAQMAVFLLKGFHGSGYVPPACTGRFGDVACPSLFADWIEELLLAQVTAGCSTNPLLYCPSNPVKRGQMAAFLVKMFALPPPPVSRYDWPQFHFEPGHGGNNTGEALVSRDNAGSLSQLFAVALPEIADGAPIVAPGIATLSGTRDLVFVTTKAGRLVARDARTGAAVWATAPPSGPNYTTSSPVLDPDRQFVYGYALDGFVHKYAAGDGGEVTSGGWPQLATLKPDVEKGSASLALATVPSGNTYLYAANGGYPGDAGDYQGHLTAIRLSDGVQHVFNANCSDKTIHFVENGGPSNDCPYVQSAIWARVGAVYDARTALVYVATGNGVYDGNAGGHEWGDSVLALSPNGTGTGAGPLDSYTPVDYLQLQNQDLDLGSTAPALLPVTDTRVVSALAVQSGKDALLRLIDLANLSRQGGPGHVGGELQILDVPQGGEVLTAPAVWVDPEDSSTWLFIANGQGISGLQLVFDGSGNPSLVTRWNEGPGGSSPIVVNSMVFYAGSGRIAALDPRTGSVLWSDNGIGGIHWESPVLANGILYITDETGALTAYAPGGVAP